MEAEVERTRLLRVVRGQLESELFLGGKWLPISGEAGGEVLRVKKDGKSKQRQEALAEIAERVRNCCGCGLHKMRTKSVVGEGSADARLVFVGEAPGADEDASGRPFVGRAGKLLTSIIEAMGFKREEVFIGNILKCRPPGNRNPQMDEIDSCRGFLYEQLEVIEPEVIVALGAYAAQTLLESNLPIGELRGKVHEFCATPMGKPIKFVATYHPAYLLRNYTPDARGRVWQDMQKVLGLLGLEVPRKK
ncbi:MAG: uracil-DNA glycosylase [Sedimentisphaerales bacterium]|nr:uracil-DNA glycosylase [Sedimentisphaerales bacterium]